MNYLNFNEVKKQHLQTLKKYVPVVARVHGVHHPEFYEVQKVYDSIVEKIKAAGTAKPELHEEFSTLRDITDNYTVPEDVCESYKAVYDMLAELDKAY
jgi:iron-sulfur cluster repair protein YtfE (RIC family)